MTDAEDSGQSVDLDRLRELVEHVASHHRVLAWGENAAAFSSSRDLERADSFRVDPEGLTAELVSLANSAAAAAVRNGLSETAKAFSLLAERPNDVRFFDCSIAVEDALQVLSEHPHITRDDAHTEHVLSALLAAPQRWEAIASDALTEAEESIYALLCDAGLVMQRFSVEVHWRHLGQLAVHSQQVTFQLSGKLRDGDPVTEFQGWLAEQAHPHGRFCGLRPDILVPIAHRLTTSGLRLQQLLQGGDRQSAIKAINEAIDRGGADPAYSLAPNLSQPVTTEGAAQEVHSEADPAACTASEVEPGIDRDELHAPDKGKPLPIARMEDVRANGREKPEENYPDDPVERDLLLKLKQGVPEGSSEADLARAVTGETVGADKTAKRLLARLRRKRDRGTVVW